MFPNTILDQAVLLLAAATVARAFEIFRTTP
jgi:hypothetical protein